MNELNKVGDRFEWFNGQGVIVNVADDVSTAEIKFTQQTPPRTWTSTVPLPISPGAIPIDET